MSNLKKWLIVLLSVIVAVSCGLALAACNSHPEWHKPKGGIKPANDPGNPNGDYQFYYPDGTDPNQFVDTENAYVISTVSRGGIGLNNVKVSVSKNGVVVAEGRSVNGTLKLAIPADDYTVEFTDLPAGYFVYDETITRLTKDNKKPEAKFDSKVIEGQTVPSNHTYRAGEVMYDFELTDADGYPAKLSDLLKTYKFVLLNLFYIGCGPCRAEFPAMERTYQSFKDEAQIISISNQDSKTAIKNFRAAGYSETINGENITHPYTFFMTADTAGLTDRFGTGRFPTNVFIDRYGVIAYIETGNITADASWIDLFNTFTSDSYSQNSGLIDGSNNSGSTEATPPNDYIKGLAATSQDLSDAVVDSSMLTGGAHPYASLPLNFYGPDPAKEDEANDAAHSWPWKVGDNAGQKYIGPTNVGNYNYTEEGVNKIMSTDNTYSMLYTDITLQADETLSLEYKLKVEGGDGQDILYIIVNDNLNYDLVFSTSTEDKWVKVNVYTATYQTIINVRFMYVKDQLNSPDDEFVGIRNIKVAPMETPENTPLDVKTQMATPSGSGLSYANYYKGEDGFYRIGQESTKSDTDPLVYVDVYGEDTYWVDRHIKNYTFLTDDNQRPTKSIYNLCFYKFNTNKGVEGAPTAFSFDPKDTIIDAYYITRFSELPVPLDDELLNALKGFASAMRNEAGSSFENGTGSSENEWLEMCFYYRTLGKANHNDNPEHLCLASQDPTEGLTVRYAIPVESSQDVTFDVSLKNKSTERNRAGGLFYSFKAPVDGAYTFSSSNVQPLNTDDTKIYIWKTDDAAYKGDNSNKLAEKEGFNGVYAYLAADQTVYLQLTQSNIAGTRIEYKVTIKKEAEEAWVLEDPSPDNVWTYDYDEAQPEIQGENYYDAVTTKLGSDGIYHVVTNIGGDGSPIYINFTRRNFYDQDGRTLEQMIEGGAFEKFNADSQMREYLAQSKANKDPHDWNYGLLEAKADLVNIIVKLTMDQDKEATLDSGLWKSFGKYVKYYGNADGGWKEIGDNTVVCPAGWIPAAD